MNLVLMLLLSEPISFVTIDLRELYHKYYIKLPLYY